MSRVQRYRAAYVDHVIPARPSAFIMRDPALDVDYRVTVELDGAAIIVCVSGLNATSVRLPEAVMVELARWAMANYVDDVQGGQ